MYDSGLVDKEQTTQVHLFGIKFAREISNMSLAEIVGRAGIAEPYKTEIRKGIKLAKYVRVIE
jgi:hypothetical protein